MPDYSDRYGGRFLNATHVIKPFVGVVDRVEDLEVEEGKKPKPVLFLRDLERGIVLNATRYDAMADITGSRNHCFFWPRRRSQRSRRSQSRI